MIRRVLNLIKDKKRHDHVDRLKTDVHSHLLPGLDDGVENYEEALAVIRGFHDLGYQKLITTPHISQDFYSNSEDDIQLKLLELKSFLNQEGISIEIIASAEYYLDDYLLNKIRNQDSELLTFGDKYLLFETSFLNEPLYLNDFIFEARSRGYQPVMAHPERYVFINGNFSRLEDLLARGVLFQVNINSFSGYYSREVKRTAEKMVAEGMVHLLGSDCHNEKHFEVLQQSRQEKCYYKALQLPLLNYTL